MTGRGGGARNPSLWDSLRTPNPGDPDFVHNARGYNKGCRCDVCRDDSNRARRERARRQKKKAPVLREQTRWISAEPVQEHLRKLMTEHPDWATLPNLVALSGVTWNVIGQLSRGERKNVQVATERAILRVDIHLLRRRAPHVPQRLAIQRVGALQAQGYPSHWQAHQTGTGDAQPAFVRPRKGQWIQRSTFEKIDRLYHQIGDRPGPSDRARAIGRKAGWYPAIHYTWDGELIRSSLPQSERPRQLVDRSGRAKLMIAVLRLSCQGKSIAEISELTGTGNRMVIRYRTRAGLAGSPADRVAEVKAVVDRVHSPGGLSPEEAAVELGMMLPRSADADRDASEEAA